MKQAAWKPPLLLLVTVTAALTQVGLPSLRFVFVFLFLLLCPGGALIGLLKLKSLVADWVLSVALSLTLLTLLSEVSVLTGIWSLETGFWMLNTLSIIGLGWQVWHHHSWFCVRKTLLDQ